MGYPDEIRSKWYLPVPFVLMTLGVVLATVLSIIVMVQGKHAS
jgi:hypothetical protein